MTDTIPSPSSPLDGKDTIPVFLASLPVTISSSHGPVQILPTIMQSKLQYFWYTSKKKYNVMLDVTHATAATLNSTEAVLIMETVLMF